MSVPASVTRLSIAGDDDIVLARQHARAAATELGFGPVDQSRIATAVSELTRNVVRHAEGTGGQALIREVAASDGRVGIEIVVSDKGPGIADVEQVLGRGVRRAVGLSMGLPGTRRLMDEVLIDSGLGRGTTVTVRKWRR